MKRYGKNAIQQNKYYEVGNIYAYMVETYLNGNREQLKTLYNELNKESKRDFIRYCFSEVNPLFLKEIILKTI